MNKLNIFWLRRDLRLEDNAGLYHALKSGLPVMPVFIFDTDILNKLKNKKDARVEFIYKSLQQLRQELLDLGSDLLIEHGRPLDVWQNVIQRLNSKQKVHAVYTNHDYEPYAISRDTAVEAWLKSNNIEFHTFKDQCFFEKNEVTKDDGKPYTVFTPYKNKWLKTINENSDAFYLTPYPTKKYFGHFYKWQNKKPLTLSAIGFQPSGIDMPSKNVKIDILKKYDKHRDYPALNATSRLGVHFRFGTISIRKAVHIAKKTNDIWLSELIWRDFFMQILWHFPHVATGPFRPEYENIKWRNNKNEFQAWCNGQTGYPMVDAGMRELNATGHMHNRVRMVTASFLTKHLLIDWRWGEAYFAEKLLDFDLSANNGNWQWAAGTGCDAAPYFRVFNPSEQLKKFDKDMLYIKKWVPEVNGSRYAKPIVDHAQARVRAISTYAAAVKK